MARTVPAPRRGEDDLDVVFAGAELGRAHLEGERSVGSGHGLGQLALADDQFYRPVPEAAAVFVDKLSAAAQPRLELDAGVVAAVAEAAGRVVSRAAIEWLEVEGGSVVTVVVKRSDGWLTAGAGVMRVGRAFAVAMVEKMCVAEAMRFAGATSALKCLKFGGSLGTPDRAAVDGLLAGH